MTSKKAKLIEAQIRDNPLGFFGQMLGAWNH